MRILIPLMALVVLVACGSPGPEPIVYHTDQCAYCRMAIADQSFGAQGRTAKGKVYKFDSIECLAAYELEHEQDGPVFTGRWVVPVDSAGHLVRLKDAMIVYSPEIRSPMGAGLAAFAGEDVLALLAKDSSARRVSWDEVRLLVARKWFSQDQQEPSL